MLLNKRLRRQYVLEMCKITIVYFPDLSSRAWFGDNTNQLPKEQLTSMPVRFKLAAILAGTTNVKSMSILLLINITSGKKLVFFHS